MKDLSVANHQMQSVTNFQHLVATPFEGDINAICWHRKLTGDFSELVNKITLNENILVVDEDKLLALQLSEQGQLARDIILNDLKLLKAHGASPILNLIKCYERDDANSFFPTDVYSFHVDRSPITTDTFLCTYFGEPSEILPNTQAEQKILIAEIRNELKKQFSGAAEDFESYVSEHFFDLHYQAKPNAQIINLGVGHLWQLAVDCPESKVQPCIHRAPNENGQPRLLLIC
ncbi:MAG: hypothetical protein RJA07_1214 [Bacteroidota bacterium]|jgi:hypothetical protein